MDIKGLEQMLNTLRVTAAQATAKPAESANAAPGGGAFADVLKNSIDRVNQAQSQADQMRTNMVSGDNTQNLHEVMIALQSASVSFQEMVQVRNKLVTAYQDIMNIQV